ncbi:tRNA(Ile)-lysidine synthase [Lysobacter sp. Root667]|uniref:tRNA lysidine(34) synthetase TilS n=1 Tax=Lysobacter sp. Root667 TaxID=1736581 RepID=UPI0006F323AE|nr:tRNA lysidine(34) synthetase TilS [Lysobacter sp. Root667]KRA77227.1 tRNA(Ile)-lysidine synthase [Lysobacter sp. Root667]
MPPHAPSPFADALRDLPQGPLCVGYSGGLDSTALLHLLAETPAARARGLRAWHVHHGLHAQADDWAAHCAAECAALSVPLTVSQVNVTRDGGDGPEAAARRARHAAFERGLGEGETLALAHHRDDQAETFLLRALRASGPDGLAAMRRWRDCGRGRLWRPLLELPRSALERYARDRGLRWIEDPSNADDAYDRNFLRRRVLPLLRERWLQADAALAASAGLNAQAAALLEQGDALALAQVRSADPQALSRAGLRTLPSARRARVLRRWIAELGLPPLPAVGVVQIERELLAARDDAEAEFAWHGASIRAWRDLLHAQTRSAALPPGWRTPWDGRAPLALPGGGELRLEGASALEGACEVHARVGGERMVLPGREHSHALKQVLQELGVPPWERRRLPLLSRDGVLLAAADLAYSANLDRWLRERGARLVWRA